MQGNEQFYFFLGLVGGIVAMVILVTLAGGV